MIDLNDRTQQFHLSITAFINARREAKLKGGGDTEDDPAPSQAEKYEYHAWLADAARRVSQIQAVTHVLKATHPDARGSSLHVSPATLPPRSDVGSHHLGHDAAEDIVGNAAALDVYKFLKMDVDGRRLLDWLQDDDPDLLQALHPDPTIARGWAEAFKGLLRPAMTYSSHTQAKQVYWCAGDDAGRDADYHLLQPMFPSSLVHAVHREINDARFGEANQAARQAKRDDKPHDRPYRDFRNLVARKLGGTKPQNISQLNSDRGGVNYLLASLPPRWDSDRPTSLLGIESALQRFTHYPGVNQQLRALIGLLKPDPARTVEIRDTRQRIEQQLGASLAAFGLETRRPLAPGWSRDPDCRLHESEKLWLDPERAELPARPTHEADDRAFAAALAFGDWPHQVAGRFGNWVNARLQAAGLPVGDAEHAHWARQALIDAAWPILAQRVAQPENQP